MIVGESCTVDRGSSGVVGILSCHEGSITEVRGHSGHLLGDLALS